MRSRQQLHYHSMHKDHCKDACYNEEMKRGMEATTDGEEQERNVCYNCFRRMQGLQEVLRMKDEGNLEHPKIHVKYKFCNLVDKHLGSVRNLGQGRTASIERLLSVSERRRHTSGVADTTGELATLMLCHECFVYLTDATGKAHLEYQIFWPAFFWKNVLLHRRRIRSAELVKELWRCIPVTWREWWLPSLQKMYLDIGRDTRRFPYRPCLIIDDECSVHDVTATYYEIHKIKQEKKIKDLLPYWNEHCVVPEVRCPWGCTEWMESAGMIRFDKMIIHYMNPFVWSDDMFAADKTHTTWIQKRQDMLEGARKDYLGHYDEEGIWSPNACPLLPRMNDCALIRPCIICHKELGPMVLTCKDHDGGTCDLAILICTTARTTTQFYYSLYHHRKQANVCPPSIKSQDEGISIRTWGSNGTSGAYVASGSSHETSNVFNFLSSDAGMW